MGFIIADGFDDRYWINNDDRYDDIWDGWGLYDSLYDGSDLYYHPEHGGTAEIGRYGGYAMNLTDDYVSYDYVAIEKAISSGKDWSGGIAVNSLDDDCALATFGNATKYGPIIEFDAAGEVVILRNKVGSGTEVVVRSNDAARLTMNGWIYVTFEFHVGDAGSDYINVRINGEQVINKSSTTLNFGGAVDNVQFPNTVNAADDIWLRDDTSVITPEVRILAMFPNAIGDDAECTPVGSASNYLNVDEYEQDFDITYNLVDAGEKDSFNMDAITAIVSVGIVHALVARFFVKGDAGNTEDLRPYVIVSSSKYNGTAQSVVEGRYTYIEEIWETNPDTSLAWTLADLDATQIGYEAV